ncbi:glycosyl transferase [Mycolicibacterium parafortuitum]|uniref:glycosyltransferase n=1 Tax=Mycolicibacterium parafortuitum TaxID=39692 RepID=UPI0032C463E0
MKIAVVGDPARRNSTDRDGGGHYGLADLSGALVRRGHEVRIQSAAGSIPVDIPDLRNSTDLMPAIGEIARHLENVWGRDRPDVVHCHGWVYGMAAQLAAKRSPLPTVQTFHELSSTARRHRGPGAASETAVKLETLLARNATAVTVACHDDMHELIRLGCARAKITVLAPGVEVDDGTPDEIVGRDAGGPCRLVAVARDFSTGHGLGDVLRMLPSLGDARLVLVATDGDTGGEAAGLRAMADQRRIGDRVELICGADQAGVAALFRTADVVVSPSRYEPSTEILLHAMACGAPIVAVAHGGANDAVVDDVTGILAPPGDLPALNRALRAALSQTVLRQGMGLAGRSRARSRYSWDVVAADAEAAYATAVSRHAATTGQPI